MFMFLFPLSLPNPEHLCNAYRAFVTHPNSSSAGGTTAKFNKLCTNLELADAESSVGPYHWHLGEEEAEW
jgi:hypothetical protein